MLPKERRKDIRVVQERDHDKNEVMTMVTDLVGGRGPTEKQCEIGYSSSKSFRKRLVSSVLLRSATRGERGHREWSVIQHVDWSESEQVIDRTDDRVLEKMSFLLQT